MIINKKLKLPKQPKRTLMQQLLALYGLYGDKVKKEKTIGFWNTLKRYFNRLWKRNMNK